MVTPAQRHFQKMRAKKAAEAAADAGDQLRPDASEYDLMLAKLANDKARLKQIQSVEQKIKVKRDEMLPEYIPYVDGVISSEAGVQDDVLMTIMVWRIDAGDISGAMDIADYALTHDLTTPDDYKRDTATLIAEDIAEAAMQKDGPEVSVHDLEVTLAMVEGKDMPDEVRAKLHKALGRALTESNKEDALSNLNRALQLNPKVGVKKDIEKLEREIKQGSQ